MNFGEKISSICREEKIKLKEFSRLTGIGASTIRAYSSGKFAPSMTTFNKISENPRFKKYATWLMTDTDLPWGSWDTVEEPSADFMTLFSQLDEPRQRATIEFMEFQLQKQREESQQ